MLGLNFFRQIWLYDFEFTAPEGDNPDVICLVAHELHSGQKLRLWRDELGAEPPFSTAADVLFVAYYASAEVGCHLALSWPVPLRLLDLFTEFRCLTNGTPPPCGNGLIGALAYFGLDSIGAVEKEEMRALAMRGGPWTRTERSALLDYCESDVAALTRLLSAMLPSIDLPRALLRGRFMVAAARIERNGVPVDTETLGRLKRHWHDIEDRLIADIDTDYRCYVGRSFSEGRFAEWLARAGIRWPALESGRLELKDEVFRQAARTHPEIAPLRELRYALSQMRLNELPVGKDGRNRTILSAFRATTSRNQPSSTKYIFGPGVWLRGLVKPPRGYGICYLDWEQQEFAIAGALSGDPLMLDAYRSGDPYLAFAKQAGAAPPDATKLTHKAAREQFKQCVLAVQYGMGPDSLAVRIGQPRIHARELLRMHRETYRVFWRWSDNNVARAMAWNSLQTSFGWQLHVPTEPNVRSLANFPMQSTGAEMLRLACCLGTERSVELCGPVHDAVLVCARLDRLDADIECMREAMDEASRIVLDGFEIGTEVHVVRYPDRYMDSRGKVMWQRTMRLLDLAEEVAA